MSLARRIPTNTPLQALVTIERSGLSGGLGSAGRAHAEELVATTDGRLRYGARLVLSRDLTDCELATLRELFEKALAECRGREC